MTALLLEALIPSGLIVRGAGRVLTELIRSRTTRHALAEALRDSRPEERPPVLTALADLLNDQRVEGHGQHPQTSVLAAARADSQARDDHATGLAAARRGLLTILHAAVRVITHLSR